MAKSARNYPLEDIDRETMFHPNTSIADHLKKGPHILAQARGVRVKDHQGRELIDCGVDEGVVLFVPAHFVDKKDRIQNDAGDNRREEDHAENQQRNLTPVEENPSDIERRFCIQGCH